MHVKPEKSHPKDEELSSLDESLRYLAGETHPRREFVTRLRGEILLRATGKEDLRAGRPAWEKFARFLSAARPYLAQAGVVALLAGLVVLAAWLTPHLMPRGASSASVRDSAGAGMAGYPFPGETPTPYLPGQAGPGGLPAGALARLGKGWITSLDTARDGRLAVGSSAGVCVYGAGMAEEWCSWQQGRVVKVLFNPTGDRLAVAVHAQASYQRGDKGGGMEQIIVQVLDAASGNLLAARPLNNTWPAALVDIPADIPFAWDPSGVPVLACAEDSGTIFAWNYQTGQLAWGPVSVQEKMKSMAWARGAGGESLLALGGDNGLALLDGATGQEKKRYEPTWQVSPVMGTLAVAFSPQGSAPLYLAYSYPNGVTAFEMDGWTFKGMQRWDTPLQGLRLAWAAPTADLPLELAVESDQAVQIFQLNEAAPVKVFPAQAGSPLAWANDHSGLFYAMRNGGLARLIQGQEGYVGAGYTERQQHLAWSGSDVAGMGSTTINRWDAAQGSLSVTSNVNINANPIPLGLSADGARAIYALGGQNKIVLWDTANNRPEREIDAGLEVVSAALSPSGERVAGVLRDGRLVLWDATSGQVLREVPAGASGLSNTVQQVDAIALAPNGTSLVIAYTQNEKSQVDLWELETGQRAASIPAANTIHAVAWSPDGRRAAAAGGYSAVVIDAASGQDIVQFGPEYVPSASGTGQEPPGTFTGLAFSPDGSFLATTGKVITLWDFSDGALNRVFQSVDGPWTALAFRPDGLDLAALSARGPLLIWQLDAFQPLVTHTPYVTTTPIPAGEGGSPATPMVETPAAESQTPTPLPTITPYIPTTLIPDLPVLPQNPTLEPGQAAQVQAVRAASEPGTPETRLSPDGQWQAEVQNYPCTDVGGGQTAALDVLRLVRVSDGSAVEIDHQFHYCQGLGAFGLGKLRWSPNSRFLFYTYAREGHPDGGCGNWIAPIVRYDTLKNIRQDLGGLTFSPDGKRLAGWLGDRLILGSLDYPDLQSIPTLEVPSGYREIAWAPDSTQLVYLINESECIPEAGKLSQVVLLKLEDNIQISPILGLKDQSIAHISWDTDSLNLTDVSGTTWRFPLKTGLPPTAQPPGTENTK